MRIPDSFRINNRSRLVQGILVALLVMLLQQGSAAASLAGPAGIMVPPALQASIMRVETTPMPALSGSIRLQETETVIPTETPETPTPTETETPEPTPEETFTPRSHFSISLPLMVNRYIKDQTPLPERSLYCISPAAAVPDAPEAGISLSMTIPDDRIIGDMNVYLDIDHMNTGDLNLILTHETTGKISTLIDRPGLPGYPYGCPYSDIISVLDDEMTLPVEGRCGANGRDPAGRIIPAIAGSFSPNTRLSVFDGESAAGKWTLTIRDMEPVDSGTVNTWCLAPVFDEPDPDWELTYTDLPASARISNISGVGQALPLDCESRSAVDWAAYYGVRINEFEFFSSLPSSDNPDAGFVGSVWGVWGQIPPHPYGVHVEPVAASLRNYGVPAYAHQALSWERVMQEVASGNPVFVLVIGSSIYNSPPYYHTSMDGHVSQVARYEHSAIIIGYTKDTVTILDGSKVYTRSLTTFLEGWSALGNLGITSTP